MKYIVFTIFFTLSSFIALSTLAYVASSTNYQIERDSLNIGGGLSSSTSYKIESTVGEVGTGKITSSNYILLAGYQQLDTSYITITSPADVVLSPNINQGSGGTANGSATWTVSTDNSAGYLMYIQADTSPAMKSTSDSFSNYTPAGGSPDYSWDVSSGDKEFGFSPEGNDITDTYKDNGSACGSGSDNSLTCWDSILTTDKNIASRASAIVAGSDTLIRFRAEAGSNSNPEQGEYVSNITITAVTQ